MTDVEFGRYAIQGAVIKRKLLATNEPLVLCNASLIDAVLEFLVDARIWIGGCDPFNVLRVMGQIETGADADFY